MANKYIKKKKIMFPSERKILKRKVGEHFLEFKSLARFRKKLGTRASAVQTAVTLC